MPLGRRLTVEQGEGNNVETGTKGRESARHRLRPVLGQARAMLAPPRTDELNESRLLAAQEFFVSDKEAAVQQLEMRSERAMLHLRMLTKGIMRTEGHNLVRSV